MDSKQEELLEMSLGNTSTYYKYRMKETSKPYFYITGKGLP